MNVSVFPQHEEFFFWQKPNQNICAMYLVCSLSVPSILQSSGIVKADQVSVLAVCLWPGLALDMPLILKILKYPSESLFDYLSCQSFALASDLYLDCLLPYWEPS